MVQEQEVCDRGMTGILLKEHEEDYRKQYAKDCHSLTKVLKEKRNFGK